MITYSDNIQFVGLIILIHLIDQKIIGIDIM